jgi:hypothetical protein
MTRAPNKQLKTATQYPSMSTKQTQPGLLSSADSKVRYARLIRIGNWCLVPIYLVLVVLPLYCEWTSEIPPLQSLRRIDGILTYKLVSGRAGTLVGVTTESGTRYYTCRTGLFGSKHDCGNFYFDRIQPLAGKPVSVWWFDQTVYPFSNQQRLVRLVMDGKEVIGVDDTIRSTERQRNNAPWYAAGILVFFLAIALYFESIARKVTREANIA